MSGIDVGIDQVGVYLPRYVLPLDRLAEARGVPVGKVHLGLGALAMAVAPPWEDAVTLAANAAARVLRQGDVCTDEIGLLVVATETAVDHAKPASIFLHELLGLPASCRTFEIKHACYGGTAGVMLAADWVRGGAARGRKALVVATDIARYDLGSSAEFTQGAGAAAMVVSAAPRLLRLGPVTGVFARNVYDFWRPLERREALVDGKFSLQCYLDALAGAVTDYRAALNGHGDRPILERFAAFLYHTPFPKMAHKAHRRLVEMEAQGLGAAAMDERFERSWTTQAEPALGIARESGNTYTASLYLALAWLLEREGATLEDRELALFSYGSGCCAEFFTARLLPGSAARAARIGAQGMLQARRELTVAEYEEFARAAAGVTRPPEGGVGFCHLAGIEDHRRRYARGPLPPEQLL
jgi:hydroxymethylglutaryl-CoA synthase